MVGNSTYDTLNWHDHLLTPRVVPAAPYNARNADDPKDIKHRVEDHIKKTQRGYPDGVINVR
jgi:hypothetical protein